MNGLLLHRSIEFVATFAIALSVSGGAIAADMRMPTKTVVAPPPAIDTWTFRLTPYAWATSLSGSTTIKGYTTDIDASFLTFSGTPSFQNDFLKRLPLERRAMAVLRSLQTLPT